MVIEYKFKYIIYFPYFTIGGIQREVVGKKTVTRRRTADEINQGLFNELRLLESSTHIKCTHIKN